jgi:hypothetical protein
MKYSAGRGPGGFSDELRRAIDRSGRSLASISAELAAVDVRVSPASLSAWQRGHYEPVPDRRVHALERVLGLRGGWLALRLATGRPPAARPGPDPCDTDRLQAELTTLATPTLLSDYVIIAIHDDVHVGEDHRMAITVRQTVRAVRRGVDSAWCFYSPDAAGADFVIGSAANCRIGRRVRLAGGRLATELLFDRRLARGEAHRYKFHVRQLPGGAADLLYRRTISTHTVEKLRIRAVFARRPRAAWVCHWPVPEDPASQHPAAVDEATVTLARASPAPATYGIRWSY